MVMTSGACILYNCAYAKAAAGNSHCRMAVALCADMFAYVLYHSGRVGNNCGRKAVYDQSELKGRS